jgi:hypothetical protein
MHIPVEPVIDVQYAVTRNAARELTWHNTIVWIILVLTLFCYNCVQECAYL